MLKKAGSRCAAVTLAIAIAGTGVAACGGSSSSGSSGGGSNAKASSRSGEFRLVSHTATKPGLDTLIKKFNGAYPNIKVSTQYLPTGPQFAQSLLSLVNGGNAPDVLFTNPNPASDVPAPVLGKSGKLMDLSSRPFVKQIPKADHDLFFVNGKVYAEPLFATGSGINYNASELKKRGWPVPTTFSQLIQLCGKAKAAGIHLIAFPGQVSTEAVNSVSSAFVFSKDPQWIQKRKADSVTFASSPLWQSMYQHMIQMRDAGCFQPGWEAAGVPDMGPLMDSGKTLMQLAPTQGLSSLTAERPDVQWASMPFPAETADQTRAMLGYNFALSVSANTKNKQAALTFIDFAGRPDVARQFAKLNGSVSLPDLNSGTFPSTMSSYAPFVKANKVVSRPDSQWPTPTTNNDINTVTSAILASHKNISDALASLDKSFGK